VEIKSGLDHGVGHFRPLKYQDINYGIL
jgi:hypothetical protein